MTLIIDLEIKMTNVANLADRYQAIKLEIEALERLLSEVKADIKATGFETIEGQNAIVSVGLSERSTIDQKLVKELLSAEDLALCTKVTLVETIRVKSKVTMVQA
jgi:hypothetical protein